MSIKRRHMVNQEVKGTLARLLATENLTVEHRRVTTAFFDVEKRLLCLPIWKTASETVYDLLVGHEVGHALYTPQEGLQDAPKAFVNVLEDARIERMMKVTYPGLRKTFFDGYKELWDQDFFGVGEEDLTKIPLIDRINLYYKGKANIEFNEKEQEFVDRAALTKTFKDVLDLANDLYEYAEGLEDEKNDDIDLPNIDAEADTSADKEEEVEIDPVSQEEQQETEEETEGDSAPPRQMSIGGEGEEIQKPSPAAGTEYDETESITEGAFKDALESLIDDSAKEWVYLTLPKVNVKEIVVSAEKVQEDLKYHYFGYPTSSREELEEFEKSREYGFNHYLKFKKDTQKTVNYLVKQFEMKKSADQYKRAATSKTGVIDTNALHKYKLTEDIFKKITTVPDGKNHGLVMFLDWSGSMNQVLLDTLKQTYNLICFCKKANIPFRVLAFQNGHYRYSDSYSHKAVDPKVNQLHIGSDVRLLEFFSSRQNPRSLEESLRLVYLQAFAMNSWSMRIHQEYNLGGTPLAEAIYCARDIVDDMKRVEKVQKVNVVCLTDGESNPMQYLLERNAEYSYNDDSFLPRQLCHSHGKVFFLRDPKTGFTKKINPSPYNTTKEIVEFFRKITSYNWIGIRLCSKSEANRVFRYFVDEEYSVLDKQWKKERFASVKDKMGFTEAFFMPDQGIGEGTTDLEVKQKSEVATKAELQRAFKKHMGSKMSNKTILNKFIEQIA